ncbi:fungal-specific transcription factor domain-containing protein [Aspergillus floccosus]
MSENQQNARRRVKTRSGCLRCKQRRIKCDEAVPHCNQCTRKAYECPGYKRPLKWSSKYEVGRDVNGQAVTTKRGNDKRVSGTRLGSPQAAPLGIEGGSETDPSDVPAARLSPISLYEYAPSAEVHPEGITLAYTPVSEPVLDASNYEGDRTCDENQDEFAGTFVQWPDPTLSLKLPLEDDDTCISRHYFSEICHINSCFDSHWNSFRVEVGSMMTTRPLIYHCVLSMSAAHLAWKRRDLSTAALHHRTSAISCLTGEIMKVKEDKGACLNGLSDEHVEVLLASILLGTTESGAHSIYPNPWSGICTPVFIYLAKAGTLSRQRSLIRNLSIAASATHIRAELQANLVAQAREVEQAVLPYKVPTKDRIGDPGDDLTPVAHLQQMAQIYRLSTLLELYRVFPELLSQGSEEPFSVSDRLLALATGILTLIQSIPHTSGVNCLLTIPLLIAGSTLQPSQSAPSVSSSSSGESTWGNLATELLGIFSQEQIYTHWRGVARERLRAVYHYVGMPAVTRASEILERVWDRADVHVVVNKPTNGATATGFVQWVEVMIEEKLEAVFG